MCSPLITILSPNLLVNLTLIQLHPPGPGGHSKFSPMSFNLVPCGFFVTPKVGSTAVTLAPLSSWRFLPTSYQLISFWQTSIIASPVQLDGEVGHTYSISETLVMFLSSITTGPYGSLYLHLQSTSFVVPLWFLNWSKSIPVKWISVCPVALALFGKISSTIIDQKNS